MYLTYCFRLWVFSSSTHLVESSVSKHVCVSRVQFFLLLKMVACDVSHAFPRQARHNWPLAWVSLVVFDDKPSFQVVELEAIYGFSLADTHLNAARACAHAAEVVFINDCADDMFGTAHFLKINCGELLGQAGKRQVDDLGFAVFSGGVVFHSGITGEWVV